MPNVTFTSPSLPKDVTVYAVAGDTHTLLSVAQKNKISLHFECQNGECGSCLVQVTVLSGKRPIGTALTEKEKTVLRYAGNSLLIMLIVVVPIGKADPLAGPATRVRVMLPGQLSVPIGRAYVT